MNKKTEDDEFSDDSWEGNPRHYLWDASDQSSSKKPPVHSDKPKPPPPKMREEEVQKSYEDELNEAQRTYVGFLGRKQDEITKKLTELDDEEEALKRREERALQELKHIGREIENLTQRRVEKEAVLHNVQQQRGELSIRKQHVISNSLRTFDREEKKAKKHIKQVSETLSLTRSDDGMNAPSPPAQSTPPKNPYLPLSATPSSHEQNSLKQNTTPSTCVMSTSGQPRSYDEMVTPSPSVQPFSVKNPYMTTPGIVKGMNRYDRTTPSRTGYDRTKTVTPARRRARKKGVSMKPVQKRVSKVELDQNGNPVMEGIFGGLIADMNEQKTKTTENASFSLSPTTLKGAPASSSTAVKDGWTVDWSKKKRDHTPSISSIFQPKKKSKHFTNPAKANGKKEEKKEDFPLGSGKKEFSIDSSILGPSIASENINIGKCDSSNSTSEFEFTDTNDSEQDIKKRAVVCRYEGRSERSSVIKDLVQGVMEKDACMDQKYAKARTSLLGEGADEETSQSEEEEEDNGERQKREKSPFIDYYASESDGDDNGNCLVNTDSESSVKNSSSDNDDVGGHLSEGDNSRRDPWYIRTYSNDDSSIDSDSQDAISCPPHIYFGYQTASVFGQSILLRMNDLVVYFSDGIVLDGFNADASNIELYGISHGIVINLQVHSDGIRFLLNDGTCVSSGCEFPFVKVYRKHCNGSWFSVLPGSDEAWKGWVHAKTLSMMDCDHYGDSVPSSELRESADDFMIDSFKPEYESFVRRQRVRNRRFRKYFNDDGGPFDMKKFTGKDAYTLVDIASFIGGENEFHEDPTRNLSTLFQFVRGVCAELMPCNIAVSRDDDSNDDDDDDE